MIVGSRIDVVRFSAVVMIGMAFIFVSVWFCFFVVTRLGISKTESLTTAYLTISVSMSSNVSESSAAIIPDFGEGKVSSLESSCIPCSSSEETVLVS